MTNELAKKTLRGNPTAYWWLPLDSVGFSSIDEVSGGEEEKLNVNALAYVRHHHSVANYPTIDLLTLKEMTRSLATLFGLTLPSPHKEQAYVSPIKSARSPILEAERATLTAVAENQ